jgi:hypothetical protein
MLLADKITYINMTNVPNLYEVKKGICGNVSVLCDDMFIYENKKFKTPIARLVVGIYLCNNKP